MRNSKPFLPLAAPLVLACATAAQYDPLNGQWGKDDPDQIRVMTWNVRDGLASSRSKVELFNQWTGLAVVVAAMKPDVLVLQEAGDTDNGVDTVAELNTVIDLFLHGGVDPFLGGEVTAYVQKYDPAYDLPHVFVSSETDGFNRNVLLSRFPFKDLNGDGKATQSDIPFVGIDEWSAVGDGGIRGFQFAEIDLPDETYAGDLVVGAAHLKSGGTANDKQDREDAARNVSYYVQYLLNGNGTGAPDPNSAIFDNPPATNILSAETPVILMGDWNEDESANGGKGPAEWLFASEFIGSDDGGDRDTTDSTLSPAVEPFTNDPDTLNSSTLDYIVYQDSIATLENTWIFNSSSPPADKLPPEILNFPSLPGAATTLASDHLPVLADFSVPLGDALDPPGPFALLSPAAGQQNVPTQATLQWEESTDAETYDIVVVGDTGIIFQDPAAVGTSLVLPADLLEPCESYTWGATAANAAGQTASTPAAVSFTTVVLADVNEDGTLNILDFIAYQALFDSGDDAADFNGDGTLNILDFIALQGAFASGGGC